METPKITFKACDSTNYRNGVNKQNKFIVIHYTANNGDTAKGNANYFANNKSLKASAHYFVDENEFWQSVKDSDIAYHCGATNYKHPECRNGNSIGIEICSRKDHYGNYYFKPEAVANALVLTKHLMNKYNIPIDNVIRHFDVTGKNCPAPFVQDKSQWDAFKANLMKEVDTVPEWMKKIMKDSEQAGLVMPNVHKPEEPAQKWFVLAVALNLLKIVKSKG